MRPQGVPGFQYQADRPGDGPTSPAGLPLSLDPIEAIGLGAVIRQHVPVAGTQGWLDIRMVLALNLAGGDRVEDLERLEPDSGFAAILRAIEPDVLSPAERRWLKKRWRRSRERTVPSPSAASAWLERFRDPARPKAGAGTAIIPAVRKQLRGLWQVNQALLGDRAREAGCIRTHQPGAPATLDTDATLVETHKRDALHCYKGFNADQPLNGFWAEQGTISYSEFRDGNVPAGHKQLRVPQASLAHLPASVTKVSLRSDTAGYQEELPLYCGEGKGPALRGHRRRDQRRRDRGVPHGGTGGSGDRMQAADPDGGRQAAADRSGIGGHRRRAQLGD
jgi:hypothetical protein